MQSIYHLHVSTVHTQIYALVPTYLMEMINVYRSEDTIQYAGLLVIPHINKKILVADVKESLCLSI